MFFKIVSILGSLTLISRILGYVRDLLIARLFGAGLVSDAFFVSFKLPNLFRRLFAEGSLNSAFIPVVSGIKSKFGRQKSDEFLSTIFSILLSFLFILLIICELLMPIIINLIAPGFSKNPEKFLLSVDLARLTFPFVVFVCLTSLIGGYLNTLGKFAAMAVTPIILNLTMILTLIIFFKLENQTFLAKYLSFSISLAGLIQIIWIITHLKRNNSNLIVRLPKIKLVSKPSPEFKKFFVLLTPAIIGNGAYQLNLLIDMILASTLPDGSISFLYYADRVNQLPLGVLGIAISTALLPILSKQVKENKNTEAKESISKALEFGIFFSIPAFFGILFLSEEIIKFLFFRGEFDLTDVSLTAKALVALSFGLPAFILIKILVVPFFANENTKTPIRISVFCMIVNLILNLILIGKFLHVGLAIATSVSAWINVIILSYYLFFKQKYSLNKSIIKLFLKVLFSSLLMSGVLYLIMKKNILSFIGFDIQSINLLLLISIFFGIITYFFSSYLLGVERLYDRKWNQKSGK